MVSWVLGDSEKAFKTLEFNQIPTIRAMTKCTNEPWIRGQKPHNVGCRPAAKNPRHSKSIDSNDRIAHLIALASLIHQVAVALSVLN